MFLPIRKIIIIFSSIANALSNFIFRYFEAKSIHRERKKINVYYFNIQLKSNKFYEN